MTHIPRCRLLFFVVATLFVTGILQPQAEAAGIPWVRDVVWKVKYGKQADKLGMTKVQCKEAAKLGFSPKQFQNWNKYAAGWDNVSITSATHDYMNANGERVLESITQTKDLADGRIYTDVITEVQKADGTVVEKVSAVLQDAGGNVMEGEEVIRTWKADKVIDEKVLTAKPALKGSANKAAKALEEALKKPTLVGKSKQWIKEHPYGATGIGVGAVVAVVAVSNSGGGGGGGGGEAGPINGTLSGGWSGDGWSGTFSMRITDGRVSGSYRGNASGSLSGTVTGSGSLTATGGASGGVVWSGTVRGTGDAMTGSGSWSGNGLNGTWSGN